METKISKYLIKKFRDKLGGRIIYSSLNKRNIVIEYDYILYTVMNYYRGLKRNNWYSSDRVKEQLQKHSLSNGRFSIYNWHIINRFYLVRKAIKESQIEYSLDHE